MPRAGWLAVALLTTGITTPAVAQPLAPVGGPPLASTPVTPTRSPDRPPPILGAPVGVADAAPPALTPAGFVDAQVERKPQRAAGFGAPSAASSAGVNVSSAPATPIPAAVVDANIARTAYQPPAADSVNEFLSKRSELKERDPPPSDKSGSGFPKFDFSSRKFGGEKLEGVFGSRNGDWFRSDHLFDGFISPVTNPFLFEDPRALTEVRPIFIYQRIPGGQADFLGGNTSFFGTQLRVAITDRWSVVFNKLGGLWLNPNSASPIKGDGGFAELWVGPKYTFIRNDEAGRVMAGGLTFQLPVGSKSVYQDTGKLSVVPYVSYAESFGKDWKFGGINVMGSTGYSLSTNKARSDYFYASGHVDWDLGNYHRIYPLAELNYTLYTTNGSNPNFGSEGRDLINFGGQARGHGMMSAAFGARGKITESAQMGAAFEVPIAGNRDLFRYRFTIDFVLKY